MYFRASQSRTWMYTRSTWCPCRCSTLKVQVPAPRSSSWLTKAVSTNQSCRKSVTIQIGWILQKSTKLFHFFVLFCIHKHARGLKRYAHCRILHKFRGALDVMCECEIVLAETTRPTVGAGQIYAPHGLLWSELWARGEIDFSPPRSVANSLSIYIHSLSLHKYSSRGRKSERSFLRCFNLGSGGVSAVFSLCFMRTLFSRRTNKAAKCARILNFWVTRLNHIYMLAHFPLCVLVGVFL